MNKPVVKYFDFGQSSGDPLSHGEKENNLPPDNLILVDAYWEKDGMEGVKIRIIPHQMKDVVLKTIFVLEHNNDKYDKNKAVFELSFESPDTIYSKQDSKKIIIKGSEVKELIEKGKQVKNDNRPCYYYEIKKFSSDLSEIDFG